MESQVGAQRQAVPLALDTDTPAAARACPGSGGDSGSDEADRSTSSTGSISSIIGIISSSSRERGGSDGATTTHLHYLLAVMERGFSPMNILRLKLRVFLCRTSW